MRFLFYIAKAVCFERFSPLAVRKYSFGRKSSNLHLPDAVSGWLQTKVGAEKIFFDLIMLFTQVLLQRGAGNRFSVKEKGFPAITLQKLLKFFCLFLLTNGNYMSIITNCVFME